MNDFFKAESTAIDNYEAEMSQYLDLTDVVISEKKSTVVQSEPSKSGSTQPVKKKDKRPHIVISDDEFETRATFKQSKLNFGSKPKESLFSCLPTGKSQTSVLQISEPGVKACVAIPEEGEEDVPPNPSEDRPMEEELPVCDVQDDASFEELPLCDVQHDVSFEDVISEKDADGPTNKINPNETGFNDKAKNEYDEIPQSQAKYQPSVEDLKENELSMSLFDAINETWDFELSQKAPDLVEIPAPPSQVPSLEMSDFSFTCSQPSDCDQISTRTIPIKPPEVPLCPEPRLLELSSGPPDEIEDTLISKVSPKLNPQTETLFDSLAKMEKQQSVVDDEDLLDNTPDITFSNFTSQEPASTTVLHGAPEPMLSTPAPDKPFQPLESSTPAVIKLPARLDGGKSENKDFVTPQVKHCLKRVKKKTNLASTGEDPSAQFKSETVLATSNITMNEDSPLNVGKRKRRCNILCSQVPSRSDDFEITNNSKKSRLFSPDKSPSDDDFDEGAANASNVRSKSVREIKTKPKTKKVKAGAAACPYVITEAELSGDDDLDEGAEEDLMSSSLEDFIDEEGETAGKLMNWGDPQVYSSISVTITIRTVGSK